MSHVPRAALTLALLLASAAPAAAASLAIRDVAVLRARADLLDEIRSLAPMAPGAAVPLRAAVEAATTPAELRSLQVELQALTAAVAAGSPRDAGAPLVVTHGRPAARLPGAAERLTPNRSLGGRSLPAFPMRGLWLPSPDND